MIDIIEKISGSCFCGALNWRASYPILWAAHCHCEDCRRAASSDYVSWFGVKRESVEWQGPRKSYHSTKAVVRSFCENCGAPASFETTVFPNETHLYAATLDNPEIYKPTAHIFWTEHLPWVQPGDELPKHPKGLQHAAKVGISLIDRNS